MINTVSGTITAIEELCVTIDVGTIGFEVYIPATVQVTIGKKTKLFVYMHWNQEQGPSLYGFETELDKTVFLLIISCSGIGPKIALAALSQLGGAAFVQAVQQGDDKALSNINGIGAKKAEQMIVQLKHKVAKLLKSGISFEGAEHIADWHTVSEVLSSLNYKRHEINAALKWLQEHHKGAQVPFDKLVRQALSFLAKKA